MLELYPASSLLAEAAAKVSPSLTSKKERRKERCLLVGSFHYFCSQSITPLISKKTTHSNTSNLFFPTTFASSQLLPSHISGMASY
jgi:hypothetical protein